MGQTPAKLFPPPTSYGQSPDMGIVAQAQAAPPVPQQNFLPLNPQQQSQPAPSQQQPGQFNLKNFMSGFRSNRFTRPNIGPDQGMF